MVDFSSFILRRLLRRRLAWFLRYRSPWRVPLIGAFHSSGVRVPIYLFGGTVRDLVIFGRVANPVDIDLVVGDVSSKDLESVLGRFSVRKTYLGGLKLLINNTSVDIWPLSETWAFRTCQFQCPTFSELPKTTFLNVEAIAVELTHDCSRAGRIYSRGFFEGIVKRTIDINFEPNPYPGEAVIRSMALAGRIGFSVGPRLAARAADLLSRSSVVPNPDSPVSRHQCPEERALPSAPALM
jgi:hypothetical protein